MHLLYLFTIVSSLLLPLAWSFSPAPVRRLVSPSRAAIHCTPSLNNIINTATARHHYYSTATTRTTTRLHSTTGDDDDNQAEIAALEERLRQLKNKEEEESSLPPDEEKSVDFVASSSAFAADDEPPATIAPVAYGNDDYDYSEDESTLERESEDSVMFSERWKEAKDGYETKQQTNQLLESVSGLKNVALGLAFVVFLGFFSQVPVGEESLQRYQDMKGSASRIDLGDLNPDE